MRVLIGSGEHPRTARAASTAMSFVAEIAARVADALGADAAARAAGASVIDAARAAGTSAVDATAPDRTPPLGVALTRAILHLATDATLNITLFMWRLSRFPRRVALWSCAAVFGSALYLSAAAFLVNLVRFAEPLGEVVGGNEPPTPEQPDARDKNRHSLDDDDTAFGVWQLTPRRGRR